MPIDAVIDDAARSLTAGQPGPWFSKRVTQRLAGRPGARTPRMWIAAGAMGMAVLVILVWPRAHDERRPNPNEDARAVGSVQPAPPPQVSARTEVSSPRVGSVARPGLVPTQRHRRNEQRDNSELPAITLAEIELIIEPVVIERLVTARVALDAVQAPMPLGVEPLAVEPLSIR